MMVLVDQGCCERGNRCLSQFAWSSATWKAAVDDLGRRRWALPVKKSEIHWKRG